MSCAAAPRTGLAQSFNGRRVLVTGHTGFKGAWLSLWLLELGAVVTGYALNPPTDPSLFETLTLSERLDHRFGDIRDSKKVLRLVKEVRPHYLFHLAAQSLVRQSFKDPLETFETNVLGTTYLLEAVRQAGKPCVIVAATSDKCYDNRGERREFKEDDPLGGRDPYSSSKAAAELLAASYRCSFFDPRRFAGHRVALSTVRAGNVIGGGDWAQDRIVPDIARALIGDGVVRLRNPSAVRPWQYVLDALSGYLWLAAVLSTDEGWKWAEAWNFGPPREAAISVSALTDRFLKMWPEGRWEKTREPSPPPEAAFLSLDCGKALERLRWRPAYDLDTTIASTVQWYRAASGDHDLYQLSREQIRAYSRRAREEGLPWAVGPEG